MYLIATLSALTWHFINRRAGEQFSNELIPIWNTLTRFGFFIIIGILLIKLKTSLNHESNLARTDFLTGAANSLLFYETAQIEIDRSRRYRRQFSICYLDADNFKKINDTYGHNVGSELLVRIVQTIKQNLRSTDVIARVGGDEFAILFCETNQEQARTVITKIRERLHAEMEKENWQVTFSIGVLTCINIPKTVDEVIKIADDLMYLVKKEGKNSVKFKKLN